MMNENIMIDLDSLLGKKGGRISVLAGKDRGSHIRNEFNLDSVDNTDEIVCVKIPNELRRITPSFFLGLFSSSLDNISNTNANDDNILEQFLAKFKFEYEDNSDKHNISDQISEGVSDYLTSKTSLTHLLNMQ